MHHSLIGKRTRRTFQLGQQLSVVLHEANQLTGSMLFHLEEAGDKATRPRAKVVRPGRPPTRSGKRRF